MAGLSSALQTKSLSSNNLSFVNPPLKKGEIGGFALGRLGKIPPHPPLEGGESYLRIRLMHMTLVAPTCGALGLRPTTKDLLGGNRIGRNDLLGEAIEELPPRSGGPAVEPEGELVQVGVQVRRSNGALMRAQQPAFQQSDHPV